MFKHTYYISMVSQSEPLLDKLFARDQFEAKAIEYFNGFTRSEAVGEWAGLPPERTLVYTIITGEERAMMSEALAAYAAEFFFQDSVLLTTEEIQAKFIKSRA